MESKEFRKPVVVVIDGIIAAGKSSLKDILVAWWKRCGYHVGVIDEPLKDWEKSGRLKQFYADPKRRAYQFQTRVFHDRIKCVQAVVQKMEDSEARPHIYLMERSIFTDVLFMKMLHGSGTVDDTEFEDYMNLWSMWMQLMPFRPKLFVYLKPSIEAVMQRLRNRSRDGESSVTEEYQRRLESTHDEFLKPGPVPGIGGGAICMRICTDEDFRNDDVVQRDIAERILREILELS